MESSEEKVSARQILADPAVRIPILIVFVIMLGFGIIAPILPLYARSFGVSYDAASLLISAFAFARLIFDPFAGPVVDRFGERLCAMTGVVFVGVNSTRQDDAAGRLASAMAVQTSILDATNVHARLDELLARQ